MIERRIVIGLITSTDYLKKIRPVWDSMLIESSTGRMLANWAIEFFDKYGKAADQEMETIFFKKVKEGLDKEIAEEIEEDILPDLSEEYVESDIDLEVLIPETLLYLQEQQLKQHGQQLQNIIENGQGNQEERLKQAQELRTEFKPINTDPDNSLDLSTEDALKAIENAFKAASDPVVRFPKQLGKFWNQQFIPGALISFLAPEKRGKTFWLLEIAMRATRQRKKVAFFQAGDMNEPDQLKRIGIYLTKRSNLEKYCKVHFEPVRDCIHQQMDTCTRPERECDFSPFEDTAEDDILNIEMEQLSELYEGNEDYVPCCNCKDYDIKKFGVPWVKKNEEVNPIQVKDVKKAVVEFFHKKKRQFKLSTHANGTLSIPMIENQLEVWKMSDGFVPDIIIIDYADLLVPSIRTEFRHQQNQIWKDLRRLSQTKIGGKLPLVISPTQADSKAYKIYRLELDNFSEDKRKYGHVTAMYGLNQDPGGREKALGLMRINELIIREGEFFNTNEVTVLQNLKQGRPYIASYF